MFVTTNSDKITYGPPFSMVINDIDKFKFVNVKKVAKSIE